MIPSDLTDIAIVNSPSFERDDKGLVRGLTYYFTLDGRVDYRRMVNTKHLYIAKEYEARVVKEQGKPLAEVDITLVRDDWLRIKIGGINQLANIRGYRSLEYPHLIVTEGKASCSCSIEFIGNYETDGIPIVCSSIASACRLSMDMNMMGYLETFAENRAFSRCVKRALQINIVSDIEIGGDARKAANGEDRPVDDDTIADASTSQSGGTGNKPYHLLAEKCGQHNPPVTFDKVREGAIKYKKELKSVPDEWTGFESIPPLDAYLIMTKMDEKAAALAVKSDKKS